MTIDPKTTKVVNEVVEVNDIPYQLDVAQASDVEILIDHSGKKMWVNVDGICALRVGRIDRISLVDNRPDGTDEARGGNHDQHTDD